ncbi:hypothetical protein BJV77DRAFT_1000146 [Russula vinacea]|nr:hypothetical protein BJV77DRAFT_1000146 [Russula vinacea]
MDSECRRWEWIRSRDACLFRVSLNTLIQKHEDPVDRGVICMIVQTLVKMEHILSLCQVCGVESHNTCCAAFATPLYSSSNGLYMLRPAEAQKGCTLRVQ